MEAAKALRLPWTCLDSWVVHRERQEEERKEAVEAVPATAEEGKDASGAAIARLLATLSTINHASCATDDDDGEEDEPTDYTAIRFPPPTSSLHPSLHLYYLLDPSSLLPVQSLSLSPHHSVLDMCAAPGGKSLAVLFTIASLLTTTTAATPTSTSSVPPSGASYHLTCNELSQSRRQRLQRVLASYVPTSVRSHVSLTSHSATSLTAFAPSSFDRVLLDAPCSSSRHLLHSLSSLPSSSASASARSAAYGADQQRMLHAGLRALRTGGRLVYSTCSLSPQENELVVDSMWAKWAQLGVREVVEKGDESWRGERRQYGRLVLPDVAGFGPLYYCVLEKAEDSRRSLSQQQEVEGDEQSDEDEADVTASSADG